MSDETRQAQRPAAPLRLELNSPYRMNIPMLLLTVVLICYGLIILFSASMATGYANTQNPLSYVLNQGRWTIIGIMLCAVLVFIPVRIYDHIGFVVPVYFLTLALVVYTKFKGEIIGGSRRWILIGGQTFQTSEFAKIALIFCIAGYRSFTLRLRKKGKLVCKTRRGQSYLDAIVDVFLPAMMLLVCLVFVFLQPHMSFFIIMLTVSFICFLVSGIPLKRWIDGGLMLVLVLLIGANSFMTFTSFEQKQDLLGNYQHVLTRLDIFAAMSDEGASSETDEKTTDSSTADENEVYQSKQSRIAIGSGGLFGVGFGNSRQKYKYLPEAHNDYVFAIACEELGFVGGVSIILLFLAFMAGGYAVAWHTKGVFSRIMCVGYTSLITIQAFLNIAVAIGAIPPTGITLPFFSYGGTANLFFLIAVGIILAISRTGLARKKQVISIRSEDIE